jgi:Ca-activated chloride channel family protein
MEIVFSKPVYLWFLVSIFFLILLHFYSLKHTRKKALKFANFDAIARVTGEEVLSKNIFILFIRVCAIFFAVLALTGTTVWYVGQSSDSDFVLALDSSASMIADDFEPNRLEAAKQEAINFVDYVGSKTKIGLVVFSGVSFVEPGLIDDPVKVKELIKTVKIDRNYGGTNLGSAITNAVNLLLNDEKSRSIILLTDGRNNIGNLDEAIDYARENHVVIYTIGIGTEEGGKFLGEAVSKLDEESLELIAFNTGGRYFRANDKESLGNAYKEIANIGRNKISLNLTPLFMLLTLLLLFFEWMLVNTKYRILP